MAVLMLALEPAYHWSRYLGMADEECPNHDGNGNAGPFAYTNWDYGLPALALLWVLAIVIEQALPDTRKHQSGQSHAIRAFVALVGSTIVACGLPAGLAAKCG
jgi:hypothetical protein